MNKIGFFGGCFNPPTIAHFEIVKSVLNTFTLDKIIIVPMGDKYPKKDLISFKHRFKMLNKMFEKERKVEISNMQNNQEKMSYATDSFQIIDELYKDDDRFFIMGLDNFIKINSWKDGENLLLNRKFIVLGRNNYHLQKTINNKNIYFIDLNNNTSSTLVRKKIKLKESFEKFIVPEVANYINHMELYK